MDFLLYNHDHKQQSTDHKLDNSRRDSQEQLNLS